MELTLLLIFLLTIGNLRGIRESSRMFGTPTYLFIVSVLIMIVTGLVKTLVLHQVPAAAASAQMGGQMRDVSVFLILKAFSSGCTALSGVEAVSNGVPAFKEPSVRRAKRVLALLGALVFTIFLGVCLLASLYKATYDPAVTVVAQIAMGVFGRGSFMFYVIQVTTAVILIMAANTAYAGLPMLLSLLAKDGFVARAFASRGARLTFSNGILLLFTLASVLVIVFRGETHLLIPLYAVGVFLSFTLSQAGMFKRWRTRKGPHWKHKAFVNGFGALVTAVTSVIVAANKFVDGAWLVLLLIPLLVILMLMVRKHYTRVRNDLVIPDDGRELIVDKPLKNYIVLPIQSVNKSFVKALNYAISLGGTIEVYHVSTDSAKTERLRRQYEQLNVKFPLIVEEAPYRNVNEMLLAHIDKRQHELKEHQMLTVVLPQFVITRWWHNALHNQTSLRLKSSLYHMRNVAVITIPFIFNE